MNNQLRNGRIHDWVNKTNILQIADRKLFYAGMPVTKLVKNTGSLFPCRSLYDIISLDTRIGVINLNEAQLELAQKLLTN